MRPLSVRLGRIAILASLALAQGIARADPGVQEKTVTIGPEYRASGFHKFWLGSGYRDLWTTPVTVPVLDLKTYAGGLTPSFRVGQRQTPGLALAGADGRSYTFRSLQKRPDRALPEAWQKSLVGSIVRDHTSSNHPGAALLLPPLAEAAGLLHTEPHLVVMPDDSSLGKFREGFAGAPGTIEEYPRAGPGVTPFHGATEIIRTPALWNRWLQGPDNRVNSRAFLRARVLDLYVGNWDRHRGQWRWARLPGDPLWEPLPEDPDMAFIKNGGFAISALRNQDPKLISFEDKFDSRLEGATINGSEMDRWLLTDLDRESFEQVVRETQAKFTDDVIEEAVHRLPPEWQPRQSHLASELRERRKHLVEYVMHYYRDLARQVDIHATDRDDSVSIQRLDHGLLEVRVSLSGQSEPYYQRRFLPSETKDVRIFLHGGNDRVERSGRPGGSIHVQVIAGDGTDTVDDSKSGGTDIWKGGGTLTEKKGKGTDTHAAWSNPAPDSEALWLEPRNWGHWTVPLSEFGYTTDLGLVVGVGLMRSTWGFRSIPNRKHERLTAAWSFGESRGRVSYLGTFRHPGSRDAFQLDLLGSGIEEIHFFGFGNENSFPSQKQQYLTGEQLVSVRPSFLTQRSRDLELHMGPTFRFSDTPTDRDNLLNASEAAGRGSFREAGVQAGMRFENGQREEPSDVFESAPTRSVQTTLNLDGFYMAPILDVDRSFGGLEGEIVSRVGPSEGRAQLAVRAGAKQVWGDHPWFESAFLGGLASLPGYSRNRFAGNTSFYSGVEASAWLFTLKVPVPLRFGILGLGDIGRVWLTGEQSDEWHKAWGAGATLHPVATRFTLTGAVAKSPDQTRVYVTTRSFF